MRVLLASSEVAPFAKTGGLADVAGALPKALAKLGHDSRVVLPKYRMVDAAKHQLQQVLASLPIPVAGRTENAAIWQGCIGPVPVYFIGNDGYYDRDTLYQTEGEDYPDNAERFALLSRAALEMARALDFVPDIFHCNDWQTGLIPTYLRTTLQGVREFQACGTLFTVHNLGYQGLFGTEALAAANLGHDLFNPFGIEFYGKVNFLKAGLVFSDLINTVSRKYSQEIQTEAFGHGLEGVLRARAKDVHGILNGIDYDEWHPGRDPFIAAKFTHEDLTGKAACKADLQRTFGMAERPDVPLLAVISRLAPQKGMDLVAEALDAMLGLDTQFVLLGTGDPPLHKAFEEAKERHGPRIGLKLGFDVSLSHKIEAGADMFLMPSRYEPCGLNQMYSLAYGTVPVVRATGGLDDTIQPFDPATGEGTGFKFAGETSEALLEAVRSAVALYRQQDVWRRLVRNGMACDFSWDRSAREYEALYRQIVARRTGKP
ncbi:MAG TPA: glycogen synthase GlgA [Candidatus Methylomirabilis sp.]|nr:glycogen synthase GlgA [Candidatus Methylomirabilis sp.]